MAFAYGPPGPNYSQPPPTQSHPLANPVSQNGQYPPQYPQRTTGYPGEPPLGPPPPGALTTLSTQQNDVNSVPQQPPNLPQQFGAPYSPDPSRPPLSPPISPPIGYQHFGPQIVPQSNGPPPPTPPTNKNGPYIQNYNPHPYYFSTNQLPPQNFSPPPPLNSSIHTAPNPAAPGTSTVSLYGSQNPGPNSYPPILSPPTSPRPDTTQREGTSFPLANSSSPPPQSPPPYPSPQPWPPFPNAPSFQDSSITQTQTTAPNTANTAPQNDPSQYNTVQASPPPYYYQISSPPIPAIPQNTANSYSQGPPQHISASSPVSFYGGFTDPPSGIGNTSPLSMQPPPSPYFEMRREKPTAPGNTMDTRQTYHTTLYLRIHTRIQISASNSRLV